MTGSSMVNCRSVHSCGFLADIWEICRPRKQIVQVVAILIVNMLWYFGKNVPQIFIGPKLIGLRRFDDAAVYQGTCFRSLDGIHEMPIGTTYTEGTSADNVCTMTVRGADIVGSALYR